MSYGTVINDIDILITNPNRNDISPAKLERAGNYSISAAKADKNMTFLEVSSPDERIVVLRLPFNIVCWYLVKSWMDGKKFADFRDRNFLNILELHEQAFNVEQKHPKVPRARHPAREAAATGSLYDFSKITYY